MRKKTSWAGLAGFALVIAAVGMAWACTPQARMFLRGHEPGGPSPAGGNTGAAGGQVALAGDGVPEGTIVEIRWNGLGGQKLAEAIASSDGTFAADVTVPQAAAGVYYFVAVPKVAEPMLARQAFVVKGAGATTLTENLWAGFESNPASIESADAALPGSPNPASLLGAGMALVATMALGGIAAVAVTKRRRSRA